MSPSPVHFLLVDDLAENLLSLEALLRRDGLVLLKASSGPEALELLLTHEVGLALLDVQMPGMDGFELAELMRGTERTRRVPIIFLTAGEADRQRRFRGYETGAVDFLHKPIEPDILRSKAEVFFELNRQQQLLEHQRDELRDAAAALKEADRRKDEFLATLAHELRNPLAPIRNGLQVLRLSASDKKTDEVRDMMDRQLTHLVRLIDDLLDVSRVSQGKIDLRRETISVQDVLQSAIETSRPLIESAKHVLTLDVPQTPLWLDADLTRLAQVVGNLLNNAAKYTPEGGAITLSAREEGDDVAIGVSDNGSGIPADMLPKVFDLFTQVDRTMDRAQGGLGIGLALVKRLVEMHGGRITAESAGPGQGSRFTLRLPLAAAPDDMIAASDASHPTATTPLNVLVVDDNIASAKTPGWMLELIGHHPTLAHHGLEALELAQHIQPDIIMLDIGLPGMNGYDLCRALRKDARFKDTIFIAQTGWGQARDRALAKEAGFDHHLVKPVDFQKFSALLADVNQP
jgi:signal transduction histidine kinase